MKCKSIFVSKQLSFRAHQKLVGAVYETTLKDGFLGKAPVPHRRVVGYKFFHVEGVVGYKGQGTMDDDNKMWSSHKT